MKKNLILFSLLFTFIGCQDSLEPGSELIGSQLLVNSDMESGATIPDNWIKLEETGYKAEWTTEESSSGTKSLKISATESVDDNIGFWGQNYAGTIPVGKDVVLTVKVKGKNVIGQGISIAVRGDVANPLNGDAAQFNTTQRTTIISGDFDWTTYSVRLERIQQDIVSLSVYCVLLPNTVGSAYFDDATLIVE